ncbi:MCE family protein [Mycobacterium sp. 94-17]|uniref:MCE family protein n=1 Tax=Mycobacterium sp. 94-17 TaxID=2986147 RepID=UPI002D1F8EE4|nr:MCE family protein [Mycobacterium sp. 94-17]MEB4209565.1 MCE family protein [Mycobacterium sp. 94-17]
MKSWGVRATAILGSAVTIAGCQFGGLNSLTLPGTEGHGTGAYVVTVEIPDIAALPQNSPVKVGDVTVGSVSGIRVVQRADHSSVAAVQLSINRQVVLPANAVAMVAQTSLLGSQHVELSTPTDTAPVGKLAEGATIDTSAGRYATTEEVLSALGAVVNSGGLSNLQDITNEAYAAVADRSAGLVTLIPRLAQLTASFSQQTDQIAALLDRLDRIGVVLAAHSDSLSKALARLPAALRVLNDARPNIVGAFAALQKLAVVAEHMLSESKDDFAADLKDLYPVVKVLNDHRSDLVKGFPILPTFPFPQPGIERAVRGDFLNGYATFDLTLRRIGENFFTTSALDPNMKHLGDVVNPPDWLLGETANLSGQAADPFSIPAAPAAGGTAGQ